jgi:serine/threonine protein kinase
VVGAEEGHVGRLETTTAAPLFVQILDDLAAAHDRRIIHRDLKGANIQVLTDRTIKILDFGIAKLFDPAGRLVTTSSLHIVGTPGYMAPEQARGGQVDYRADLWALGAVFFKVLTGRLPFEGDDLIDFAVKSVVEVPPTPTELVPEIPAAVSKVLLSCLAPDPDDRPDTARMMAHALIAAVPDGCAIAERSAPDLLVRSGPSDPTIRRRRPTPLASAARTVFGKRQPVASIKLNEAATPDESSAEPNRSRASSTDEATRIGHIVWRRPRPTSVVVIGSMLGLLVGVISQWHDRGSGRRPTLATPVPVVPQTGEAARPVSIEPLEPRLTPAPVPRSASPDGSDPGEPSNDASSVESTSSPRRVPAAADPRHLWSPTIR